ncbi:DUF6976 family protein [Endozoicomonas arenosclerae]|uniref:DUF6976 family protein n=1 Tax=Endozoicomonas arenosclerae TaxID=1633495 RepID=UPI000784EA91|nr:hypothetical protein [Endozoicomonas arenosclerae]
MKKIQSVEAVSELINAGRVLSLAGDERALSKLPKGQWIAGTTPYFMGEEKGLFQQEDIYVDDLTDYVAGHKIVQYDASNLHEITEDRFENGFTILVIPAFSQVHSDYALKAPDFDGLYDGPILGWVSGKDLESEDQPKIYNGISNDASSDIGVALHLDLPAGQMADLEIFNIHKPNPDSPVIEFTDNSFEVVDCLIDGEPQNFARFINDNNVDTQSPIICDYSGADINVCIQNVDTDNGKVDFYAPVFKGRKYRLAIPLEDYAHEFTSNLPTAHGDVVFSCNCVLNFLYGGLEGKKAGFPGPITFGEIGYLLLNQTMTYLNIMDIE